MTVSEDSTIFPAAQLYSIVYEYHKLKISIRGLQDDY